MSLSFQETYPKLIHPQNKGNHCTTDHFFKAKLFLTTRNSCNSVPTIDRTSAIQNLLVLLDGSEYLPDERVT